MTISRREKQKQKNEKDKINACEINSYFLNVDDSLLMLIADSKFQLYLSVKINVAFNRSFFKFYCFINFLVNCSKIRVVYIVF